MRSTKQSHNIDSKYIEIASRFVPRGRNDEKLLFGADSLFSSAIFAQDKFTLVKEKAAVPNFTYETKDAKTINLSNLEGKVVWINFFATWCPPCRLELPRLQKEVFDKYNNKEDICCFYWI